MAHAHKRISKARAREDDMVELAAELRIYLLQAIDRRLGPIAKERRAKRWARENRAAIKSHNAYIQEYGLWTRKIDGEV